MRTVALGATCAKWRQEFSGATGASIAQNQQRAQPAEPFVAADLIQQARIDCAPLGAHKQDAYATGRSAAFFRGLAGLLVGAGRIAQAEDVLRRLRDEDQQPLFRERLDASRDSQD